ncbi:hypothetical protein OPU71_13170 [Niveibacterium sp. 24ML]|uniref:hypothetical protein n=1 Tax=Niveibacterium sp. 24ML TaxID=2985512 RepID=UPI0022720A7B|nr:hypothetical protein [Niveibacterium sp. 24ML]MCX9157077.1 hypothetical protein [Niveibacterium sp. 24ML]
MIRTLALLTALLMQPPAWAEQFNFGVFGDLPYNDAERAELPGLLAAMAAAEVAFAVHVGDMKSSNTPCDDITLSDFRDTLSNTPFPTVFVPGDNEWLDCDRRSSGGFKPEERLDKLRSLFHAAPQSLGTKPFPLVRQGDADFTHGAYMEHLRWHRGPVTFFTLNIPGSDNNFGALREAGAEFRHRMSAVRDWISGSFAEARKRKSGAVVLFMHANPDFEAFAAGSPARGYAELLNALRAELSDFEGQVLVIHGDTHVMRIDHPLRDFSGVTIERFRRAEVFGSPIPGWIEVFVNTEAQQLIRIAPRPLRSEDLTNAPLD